MTTKDKISIWEISMFTMVLTLIYIICILCGIHAFDADYYIKTSGLNISTSGTTHAYGHVYELMLNRRLGGDRHIMQSQSIEKILALKVTLERTEVSYER